MRRNHRWLVDADITTTDVTNTSIAIPLGRDGQQLTLALNTDDQTATVGSLTVNAHSYSIGE